MEIGTFKIPDTFNIGGQDFNVEYVDKIDAGVLGRCLYPSGRITIAKNVDGEEQSESSIQNTFMHELIHSILITMGEVKLNDDERFVSTFASFLLSAIKTFKTKNNSI